MTNQVSKIDTTKPTKPQSQTRTAAVGKTPDAPAKGFLLVQTDGDGLFTVLARLDSRLLRRISPVSPDMPRFLESAITHELDLLTSDPGKAADDFFDSCRAMENVIPRTAAVLDLMARRLMQLEAPDGGPALACDTVSGYEFLSDTTAQDLRTAFNAMHTAGSRRERATQVNQ